MRENWHYITFHSIFESLYDSYYYTLMCAFRLMNCWRKKIFFKNIVIQLIIDLLTDPFKWFNYQPFHNNISSPVIICLLTHHVIYIEPQYMVIKVNFGHIHESWDRESWLMCNGINPPTRLISHSLQFVNVNRCRQFIFSFCQKHHDILLICCACPHIWIK